MRLKRIALLGFLLLCVTCANTQQFRPPIPSQITNSSPERLFEAKGCTVKTFTNPETFSCHVHVISSKRGNILVDPGYYAGELKDYISSIGGVDFVLLSHCHVDHIIGLNDLVKDYPDVKVYIGTSDLEGLYDTDINYSFERVISEPFVIEREVIPAYSGTYTLVGQTIRVIPSAGHSPGSSLYYFEEAGLLFVGDAIAFGGIPRYDLLNSNVPEVFETLMHIKNLNIPPSTEVFFGHGEHISYSRMLDTYEIFTKPLELSITAQNGTASHVTPDTSNKSYETAQDSTISPVVRTPAKPRETAQDGKASSVRYVYFDEGALMISLEDIVKLTGIAYFASDGGAMAYIPQFGRLKVTAGSSVAEFDTFPVNMKGIAQVKDGKIYLPGKFIAGIFKPFIKWSLSISQEVSQ